MMEKGKNREIELCTMVFAIDKEQKARLPLQYSYMYSCINKIDNQ
jgi:hypothetical protein